GGRALDEASAAFTRGLLEGTLANLPAVDAEIQATADNWEVARMAAVDRSILRLAAFELFHCPDTPVGVVIDEAIEISKKYSSEDSCKFINGILGKLKERRAA
ncbi:MAG: N utilization substance protein B, partial [Elusimicrobia bacterium]